MNILDEARGLIDGARNDVYGDPLVMWTKVAKIWSVILKTDVTAEQALLAMIALKAVRQSIKHHHDNLVDLAAYAEILARIHGRINDPKKHTNHD